MIITDDAKKILEKVLIKYNKYAIVLTYDNKLKEISMALADKDSSLDIVTVNGINIVFKNGAFEATKNWTIIEEKHKLTIKRKDKCCCEDSCEYVCNKVTCECKK